MHQPTQWHPWGPEAFARAQAENKPILLDIGAVWCHWCHVMDRESYESTRIAAILNERFVAVKVDRDERPDVDARYQMAVAAMSGQGGWPLTVFLTPEGKPFFGGTYFPPQDGYGRPSFERILLAISEAFRERRAEVESESNGLMQALAQAEGFAGASADGGDGRGADARIVDTRIVEQMVQAALAAFDRENGGFGTAPKFAYPAVIDLLLDWFARTGEAQAGKVAAETLEKMARGGVYDQLAGGFHRYSVDEHWRVPHFEKMAYDNSELLKNYVHGWQVTGNPLFAEVARGILRWMRTWLSDRERGGYYGSQDADINLDDDGSFFTWTLANARAALTADELAVAAEYYDIGERGEMPHDPSQNVLWVASSVEEIAQKQARPRGEVSALLGSAREKLYAERLRRPMPYIDSTLYTNWNALCISAVLQAARVLGDKGELRFALRSLDRLLAEAWTPERGLLHVIAYGEGSGERPAGGLDDYAFTVLACLDAFEASGDLCYLSRAEEIAERMIAGFYDESGGGFFDVDESARKDGHPALATRRKPFQDSPTPAGDPAAALALLRLHALNGDAGLRQRAEATLKLFAAAAGQYGIYAGTYGLATVWLTRPHTQVVVVGEGSRADQLCAEALMPFALNKIVLRVKDAKSLPAALAEMVSAVPRDSDGEPMALVCSELRCLPPAHSAAELRAALHTALRPGD
jgi:hypothetical protein